MPFSHGYRGTVRIEVQSVRFSPKFTAGLEAVQGYLEDLSAWDQSSDTRPLKMAFRGILAETPTEAIAAEFRSLGHEPTPVRSIRARDGNPNCIFFTHFRMSQHTWKTIFATPELIPG